MFMCRAPKYRTSVRTQSRLNGPARSMSVPDGAILWPFFRPLRMNSGRHIVRTYSPLRRRLGTPRKKTSLKQDRHDFPHNSTAFSCSFSHEFLLAEGAKRVDPPKNACGQSSIVFSRSRDGNHCDFRANVLLSPLIALTSTTPPQGLPLRGIRHQDPMSISRMARVRAGQLFPRARLPRQQAKAVT